MKLQDFLAQAEEFLLIPHKEDGKVVSCTLEADGMKADFDVFGHSTWPMKTTEVRKQSANDETSLSN